MCAVRACKLCFIVACDGTPVRSIVLRLQRACAYLSGSCKRWELLNSHHRDFYITMSS